MRNPPNSGDSTPFDWQKLAQEHEVAEYWQTVGRKRQRAKIAWRIVALCAVIGVAKGWQLGQEDIANGYPPPWSDTLTLRWPGGMEVQATVTHDDNSECNSADFDGDCQQYNFAQGTEAITTSGAPNGDFPVFSGTSEGIPYFYNAGLLGIYHPSRTTGKNWLIWRTSEPPVETWIEKFAHTRTKVRRPRKDEYFCDAHYHVSKFEAKGRKWIITLHDIDWSFNEDNDWSGGMPAWLHVESHDFGATWKVDEPPTVPEWLIEIPRYRKK